MSFGLDFVDKQAVLAELGSEPRTALQLRESGDPRHVVIEGDNLEALKHLRHAYARRIQMIYIDPPYNTGNDFVYRDRFSETAHDYLVRTGQIDEVGSPLRSNPKTAGRYHSAWLSMMYPRLFEARGLLAPDGLIFVSIDDHEVHHLRVLMDEVFGEDCFVAQIVVVTNRGGRDYLRIATGHEYLLVYGANPASRVRELPKSGPTPKQSDSRGPYELRELRNRNPKFTPANRPNLHYPIFVDPTESDAHGCCAVAAEADARYTEAVLPLNRRGEGSVWRWGRPKLSKACVVGDPEASDVVARRRRDGVFNIYEKNRKRTSKAKGLWDDADVRTERGTIELREALGEAVFDHPKPLSLLRRCVLLATDPDDAIVLDFFAGSGTTAHAVIAQNRADGGERRTLSIQVDAPTPADSPAARAGFPVLSHVTRARIRHALEGQPPCTLALTPRGSGRPPQDLLAIAAGCGLGVHLDRECHQVPGWVVVESGERWLAVATEGAVLADVPQLEAPPHGMFWLPSDVGEDWERVALAAKHVVHTELG